MRPEPPQDVLDYIRINSATYTREVIDRELREAGHSQETIDAAWRATAIEVAAAPPASVVHTVQFWVLLIVVACVALTIVPIVSLSFSGLLSSVVANTGVGSGNGVVVILTILLPLLLCYLIIGAGAWLIYRHDQAAGLGIVTGLVVAFVIAVIIAGTCAAIVAQL
jgi:hypothetical protein